MTLRLNGSTSGYTEIDAPAVAGSNTLVLPGGNGSADQVLATNGSGTLSFVDRGRMVLSTAQNSTSGTSIDFTGIPSWVKKITVMFQGVSTSGASPIEVRLGTSSGVEATGYDCLISGMSGGVNTNTSNTGFSIVTSANAAATLSFRGSVILCNQSGNLWVANILTSSAVSTVNFYGNGSKQVASVLDRVRITTMNGTDTFDAGFINILYEG